MGFDRFPGGRMFVYAGIDEAGYGPVLGPLVVARSVFRVPRAEAPTHPASLWSALRSAVCRKPNDRRGRIAIGDSKVLYSPSVGIRLLERGVLSFLHAAGKKPGNLDQLLAATAYDDGSMAPGQPWYGDPRGGPELPAKVDPDDLLGWAGRLARTASRTGVGLEDLSTAVVYEDRFNHMIEATGSKATCVWEFVAGHLRAVWEEYAAHHPFVAVDRLGGRKNYRGLLAAIWPWADVVMTEGRPGLSVYSISGGDLQMHVAFRVRCEAVHLPTALASMAAKYIRELLMLRFRTFWRNLAPDVKPTFGCLPDGNRFAGEIQTLMSRLGIEREALVRSR